MLVGIPKEIKNNENRVGIVPAGVAELVSKGHQVMIEAGAGVNAGFADEDYQAAGAEIKTAAAAIWQAEMVIKVKEPLAEEYGYFYEGLILFTYLHLAPDYVLTKALKDAGVTAIGYETMKGADGSLPLLTPMSEVAGRMAVQVGAQFLESQKGGRGVLLSGVPGVQRGKVAIIGGGISGTNAAKVAIGMGAAVTILDINPKRLAELDDLFGSQVDTLISNQYNIAKAVHHADVVIGAVLIPGDKAPKLVTEEMVASMKPGSVLVDIAIDQGGIFETTDRVTTHDMPTYVKHGVVHYAVANMPGAVARTSTLALTNVTLPYAVEIAAAGVAKAANQNSTILTGINLMNHEVTFKAVAKAHGFDYKAVAELI